MQTEISPSRMAQLFVCLFLGSSGDKGVAAKFCYFIQETFLMCLWCLSHHHNGFKYHFVEANQVHAQVMEIISD